MTTIRQETEQALRGMFSQYISEQSAFDRHLVCTPCHGTYAEVAVWTCVLNGSGPAGTLLIFARHGPSVFVHGSGRPLAVTARHQRIVDQFAKAWLTFGNMTTLRPFTIFGSCPRGREHLPEELPDQE